ncbi:MAG TPA: phospholipase D-like domain-containing protein [Anaerolineales bacterium]|nr:phospholipase D-like domain-containing protein [Anaerolineales bacterium]
MAKKKRSARNTFPIPKNLQGIAGIAVIGLVLLFAFAGLDPLGLFSGGEPDSSPAGGGDTSPVVDTAPSSGSWWEVYFTDPPTINDPNQIAGSIEEKLIANINQATTSIHVAAFEFNLTPVAEALIAAHNRGVEVQWVTDDENGIEADEEEGHGQFAMLEAAGIEVKDDGRSALMHNKFWIFDGQTVWTGSTNITQNGMFRNNNNVIVIRSSRVAAIYEREFQEMWAGEFGPRSPSTLDQQFVTVDGVSVQILFAAEDNAIEQIISYINTAKSSIQFMAFSFTQDDLEAAMMARAEAGVDLRGIFETRGSETEFSELGAMFCAGYPMRQDGNPGTFHHKVIVIDGQTVITGSLNFSDNANDSNDENVVIISDPAIAGLYLQEFDRRWVEAKEPDGGDLGCN